MPGSTATVAQTSQYMAGATSNGVALGSNGTPRGPGKAPLPHLDDIVAYPVDIDPNQSIKRLLEAAERSLKQADFGRMISPAQALKDYIRAYTIAVHYIRRHSDYPTLKEGNLGPYQQLQVLLKKLDDYELAFQKIKNDIAEDNKRSGVQPTKLQGSGHANGFPVRPSGPPEVRPSSRGTLHDAQPAGSSPRTKPTVHPKPPSLHGNALPGHGRSQSAASGSQDLLARFNRLRASQGASTQDPRIKTYPISPLKPSGPREMPNPKPTIGIPQPVPELPKMPDAIYSPVRSNTGDMGGAPTSASRGLYQRTGSSASISSSRMSFQQTPNGDYFNSVSSQPKEIGSSEKSAMVRKLAEKEVISVEELVEAMKDKNCSILIIDIRTRLDYDEGHIMSSSIICIEPDLLLRGDPSASDLSESIEVYAEGEHALFEKRDKFDMVVFYDQQSEQLPTSNQMAEDLVISSLHRALVLLNYGHELRFAPKLLKGGLDAWIDLMGASSLQSTSAAAPRQKDTLRRSKAQRRLSKYSIKPLKPKEIEAWEETLKNEDVQSYHRSEADFLRRFPSISGMQESMTSPVLATHPSGYGSSHKDDLRSELPTPPSRPAPSVPRPSYSGFSEAHSEDHAASQHASGQDQQASGMRSPTASTFVESKHYTGLNNPGNWCYANSAIQCLLASDGFGSEFVDSTWKQHWPVPKKAGEKTDPPQLLARIMSNLFHWMASGSIDVMKAKTLMDYCRHLCKNEGFALFGGDQQQDTEEFVNFLFDALHDETNLLRDKDAPPVPAQPTQVKSDMDGAYRFWQDHWNAERSIIDKYWTGVNLTTTTCQHCKTPSRMYELMRVKPVGMGSHTGRVRLEDLLNYDTRDTLSDYDCSKCGRHQKATKLDQFGRLPSHFVISLKRFGSQKNLAEVIWDLDHLDLTRHFIQGQGSSDGDDDPAFRGPFVYECYAVITHSGSTQHSGHYWAHVRDPRRPGDRTAWLQCNDSRVTPEAIVRGRAHSLFRNGSAVPYLLFFRRKAAYRS